RYKRRPETLVLLLGWFYKKPCGIIRTAQMVM
uniref:Uncharacterized protein n=1 Tax=Aegilops tauschii subsp. strangulata TaxID=200361 RepID=A0A453L6E5_AEGTS